MILKRLYELAEREGLLQDPAFDVAPIACLIQIGEHGDFLGLTDQRETTEEPTKRKGGKPKLVVGKGKPTPIPVRPVVLDIPKPNKSSVSVTPRWKMTDPAASGQERPAVFLADTIARVLPIQRLIEDDDRAKFDAQRSTFWRFVDHVAAETNDPALRALQSFAEWLKSDPSASETLAREVEERGFVVSQHRCTFAWLPDENIPIVQRPNVTAWWRSFFATDRIALGSDVRNGHCQITERIAAIPETMQIRVNGLFKIGCRPDVNFVTGIDSADSYNLKGAETSMVSVEALDGVTRALNALIARSLPHNPTTSLFLGRNVFLFWTQHNVPTDFMSMDQPNPEQVARLMQSMSEGRQFYGTEAEQFYCLTVAGNSKKNATRLVICDYLEAPLPEVEVNLGRWFRDLEIVDWHSGKRTALFPLWMLANATIRSGDDLPPDLPTTLVSAALKGTAVPSHVLAACLRRMRLEAGANDERVRSQCFRPARMALIQLILRRLSTSGDDPMNDPYTKTPHLGYACGQLLAFLARCQSPRDFGASAQVLDRYFGSASTAPRSVFPFVLRLNRHHIRKVRDDNPGFAFNLEEELETRLAPFLAVPGEPPDFPAVLSLPEQGRFSLGFYHQRAEYRAASQDRKAARHAENA